jgi:hypothetical protein
MNVFLDDVSLLSGMGAFFIGVVLAAANVLS